MGVPSTDLTLDKVEQLEFRKLKTKNIVKISGKTFGDREETKTLPDFRVYINTLLGRIGDLVSKRYAITGGAGGEGESEMDKLIAVLDSKRRKKAP